MALTSKTFDQLITFSRTSAATYVNSAGNIAQTPASKNLLLWTEVFSDAAWSKANATITGNNAVGPDGRNTADTMTADGTSSVHLVSQTNAASPTGKTFSIYAKAGTNSFVQVYFAGDSAPWANFDLSNGTVGSVGTSVTATIVSVGDGWYRCVVSTTSTTASNISINIIPSASSGRGASSTLASTILIWGAQVELGSAATSYVKNDGGLFPARFDYDPATLAPKGLLIESQRTNLFTQSEFANGVTDAPTRGGLLSATTFSRLIGSTGLAFGHDGVQTTYAYKNGAANGTAYALSAYVLMDDGNAPVFGSSTAADPANTFAIIIGGVIANPTTYTIQNCGGGLYRVSATATAGAATANSGVVKYGANNNRTFKVSGYQLEAGSYATSYIPTAGSQVTRTADIAAIVAPNFAPWYNQSEGTFVVEADTAKPTTTSATVLAIDASDGGITNRHYLGFPSATAQARTTAGGVDQAAITQAYTANTTEKLAYAYKANDFALARNGSLAGTDASGSLPTIDRMFIGNAAGSAAFLDGHIRSIRYFPTRLSNAQLQALSA